MGRYCPVWCNPMAFTGVHNVAVQLHLKMVGNFLDGFDIFQIDGQMVVVSVALMPYAVFLFLFLFQADRVCNAERTNSLLQGLQRGQQR